MTNSKTAAAIFDQEFLPIRAKLLEVAAAFDRFGRADGNAMNDPRWHQLHAAINTLLLPDNDRAEHIQLIFSRPYEDGWQRNFRMTNDE